MNVAVRRCDWVAGSALLWARRAETSWRNAGAWFRRLLPPSDNQAFVKRPMVVRAWGMGGPFPAGVGPWRPGVSHWALQMHATRMFIHVVHFILGQVQYVGGRLAQTPAGQAVRRRQQQQQQAWVCRGRGTRTRRRCCTRVLFKCCTQPTHLYGLAAHQVVRSHAHTCYIHLQPCPVQSCPARCHLPVHMHG